MNMNASKTIASGAQPESAAASKRAYRRVVDAPTRALHWLMALCFIGAYLTGDGERWRLVHVTLGYTLVGLGAARLAWGLWGPTPARLKPLWRRAAGLREWVRAAVRGHVNWRLGQNLLLAGSIAALLALMLPLGLSGYASYNEWGGDRLADALEGLHELLANLMLTALLAHLVLVGVVSLQRRRNLVAPMVTGRLPGAGPDLVRQPHRAVAGAVLASVLAFWGWQCHTAPDAALPGAHTAQPAYDAAHDDDDED